MEEWKELIRERLPKVDQVDMCVFRLPLKSAFETSFGSIDYREIVFCELKGDGLSGFGESAADEDPLYSYEANFTCLEVLRRYLIPALKSSNTIEDYHNQANKIRGHPMAKATLEAALWDLLAKSKNAPLFRLWGGTKDKIPCGVSVGLQKDTATLMAAIRGYLSAGYRRIKIKIKPGKDRDLLTSIRSEFPEIPLMADANAAYSPEDIPLLRSFDEFRLMMVEQPLHFEDLYEHSILQKQIATPVCLDESIISVRAAEAAIQLGSCKIINIKTGRVGGHTESILIHDLAMKHEIPVWCGGMLESGVGRAHNLALASLPNFRLPGDTSASNRYWERDIIVPEVEIDSQGYVQLPERPGIGYDLDRDYLKTLILQQQTIRL